jgi:hypothetical protein
MLAAGACNVESNGGGQLTCECIPPYTYNRHIYIVYHLPMETGCLSIPIIMGRPNHHNLTSLSLSTTSSEKAL